MHKKRALACGHLDDSRRVDHVAEVVRPVCPGHVAEVTAGQVARARTGAVERRLETVATHKVKAVPH